MSLPSTWRQFQLFDFLPIRDPNYQSELALFSDSSLSAITCSQTYIAFSVSSGHVKLVSKKLLSVVKLFCAYEDDYTINFMKPLLHSDMLVTLAEKEGAPAVIKLWDLNKIAHLDDSTTASDEKMKLRYNTEVVVNNGEKNVHPVSCFLFNEFFSCIAIGYTNGRVIVVRGDLLRDRGSKQRVVYENVDPITGVHFNRSEEILYVTTTSKILTVLTTGRNQGKPLRVLSSSLGVDLGCSDLDYRTSTLIAANTAGFRYFNQVSKVHVVNFDTQKRRICRLFKDYLLVLCPNEDSTSSRSLTRILVLDMANMHVSFSLAIPNLSISHIFSSNQDGEAYLLSNDGILYKLHEKPVNQQVEIILQRNLYSIALNLAKQYNLDKPTLLRINKMHGDYLYEKQDFDTAIDRYIDCLPLIESDSEKVSPVSEKIDDLVINVITQYKEVSNIHNMTKFLAKLYELKLADSDQVTLLLCCYCKLKMADELDAFIDSFEVGGENDTKVSGRLITDNLNFSLIINLFKECAYFSQVTKLLYKLNYPHLIVGVQLKDLHQYDNCMSYIKSLPIDELLRILIDYLKDLLDNMPMETTELLINVFSGKYKPETSHSLFSASDQKLKDSEAQPPPERAEVSVSSYGAFLRYLAGPLRHEEDEEETEPVNEEPTYLPPRPSLVFSCFVNHPREFIVFLEACNESFDKYQGNINDKKELLLTLFEMYLSMSVKESENEAEWVAKTTELLHAHLPLLDNSSVLLISHLYGFTEGEIRAQEENEDFEEGLFRSAQMADDFDGAFEVVRKYGQKKPELYTLMLSFIVSSDTVFKQASAREFRELLDKVTEHRLATPVEIIKLLSSNRNASIGIVKDYLTDYVDQANREIKNNTKLFESYETESRNNLLKIAELTGKPMVMRNSKCDMCQLLLEFPLVYFKCKHAYHQRCLNENTYIPGSNGEETGPACPLCISEMNDAQRLQDALRRTVQDYDEFEQKLKDAHDRFKVLCDYLGRGVMDEA